MRRNQLADFMQKNKKLLLNWLCISDTSLLEHPIVLGVMMTVWKGQGNNQEYTQRIICSNLVVKVFDSWDRWNFVWW